MPQVRFAHSEDIAMVPTRERAPAETLQKLSEGERNTASRMLFPGTDRELQLFEVEVQPGDRIEGHAHEHDEIIYVLKGELRFGQRHCPAGAAVYVPAHTLYGFFASPDGCNFLNFRAAADYSYITREEHFRTRREESRSTGLSE